MLKTMDACCIEAVTNADSVWKLAEYEGSAENMYLVARLEAFRTLLRKSGA